MADFIDDFLDEFDQLVYKTLCKYDDFKGDGNGGVSERRLMQEITTNVYPGIAAKLNNSVLNIMLKESLERLWRNKQARTVGAKTPDYYDNWVLWAPVYILDSLAMLPQPHHADSD